MFLNQMNLTARTRELGGPLQKQITKYLGISINEEVTLNSHIGPKLVTARRSFNKLQRLWSHNDIETKFKLRIYKGCY